MFCFYRLIASAYTGWLAQVSKDPGDSGRSSESEVRDPVRTLRSDPEVLNGVAELKLCRCCCSVWFPSTVREAAFNLKPFDLSKRGAALFSSTFLQRGAAASVRSAEPMSGFDLVPVDGGDPVHLPPGETVLGRGPFLGVSPPLQSENMTADHLQTSAR